MLVPDGSTTAFLQTNRYYGPGKCPPDQRVPIANLARLRGQWLRFEVHVRWSKGNDGFAEVFLNGQSAARIKGRTITLDASPRNYFKFGIYLHNTQGTDRVVPARALYAGLARATSREGLGR